MVQYFQPIRATDDFAAMRRAFTPKPHQLTVQGLSGAQKSVVSALFLEQMPVDDAFAERSSFLAICATQDSARRFADELRILLPQVRSAYFPALEDLTFEALSQSREAMSERINALRRLQARELDGLITSVEAVLPLLVPSERLSTLPITLSLGSSISINDLLKQLVHLGYQRTVQVETPGYFAQRGGIIDVYPPADQHPLRIELFGDDIDSIRRFSEESQLTLDSVREATVYPVRELVLTSEEVQLGMHAITEDIALTLPKLPNEEARYTLRSRSERLLTTLRGGGMPDEIEHFLPYFIEQPVTLLDYFPSHTLVILDEPLRVEETWNQRMETLVQMQEHRYQSGELLPRQAMRWAEFEDFSNQIVTMNLLTMAVLPRRPSWMRRISEVSVNCPSLASYRGSLHNLMDDVERWQQHEYAIALVCDNEERGRRLQHTFSEFGLETTLGFQANRAPNPGEILLVQGNLQNSFEWPQARFILLSDHELFGKQKQKRSRGVLKESKKLTSFRDLVEGDLVVHVNHGIGRYHGVITMEIEGIKRDYLDLQYAGTDRIYVPIDQISMVQKYLGSGGTESKTPKLHSLGNSEWLRSKQRVQAAVREMAEELLELYANRAHLPGYAFQTDTPWQSEFEQQFIYEETDDQLQVIDEVKRDMERDKPMERLLCGDVGYGKTEVAIRAAFKAVVEGKQVALLAPTTVLAQQHFLTFRDRFSNFPVEIAMMSRFRTPKENQHTTELLAQGKIDIVIGTHRLLNANVRYSDLGLLIIDEEQRFGVAQKERIKKVKNNVDVLMLSATPIPRTLHMAMVGLRDMSIIETPPENRFPVQSFVVEWSDDLVREAVTRELQRDGQVFIVHNRIEDLDYFARKVSELVPDARIIVGHGQMAMGQLEQVMLSFMEREYDVLISTTIVESGLDMPNVNTLIVHDANNYGLAQLHQLRGRVGRSNRKAYAYFTFQRNRSLTEIAEKRLAAIKEFCELGAGFRIAQRDLELRGVGNLLGSQQHGNVSAVGFELYTQLLEEAVHELKGEAPLRKIETALEIQLEAFLPSSYIASQAQKIAMYKRIQSALDGETIDDIEEELIDRFGPFPAPVLHLLKAAKLRLMAHEAGIVSLKQNSEGVQVTLYPGVTYPTNGAALLVRDMAGALGHQPGKPAPFMLRAESTPELLQRMEFFLQRFEKLVIH